MDYNLTKAKKAWVMINDSDTCDVCGKKIGENVFVAFPNGVITCHDCSKKKFNVCPVTGQNFEDTFYY